MSETQMPRIILSDWWYVPNENIPQKYYNYLSIKVNNEDNTSEDISICTECFDQDGNKLISFPRYCEYGEIIFNLLKEDKIKIQDLRTNGKNIKFKMIVNPRDEYQRNAIQVMIHSDNGIIQAKTAFGKTYVAINAISKIGKKSLILVHKIALAEQWKKDILKYTDLKDDDIEILSGNYDNWDLSKPIIISTVQNFVSKNNHQMWDLRNKMISADFGITIYDEVHATAGPIMFSMSSRWFASKRIFGLSATPVRGDDNDKLIRWTVGEVIYTDERDIMPVYISYIKIPARIPPKHMAYMNYGGNDFMRRYYKFYCRTPEYLETSTDLIIKLIKSGKKILVVGKYKFILDDIYSLLSEKMIKENIPMNNVITIHGTSKETLDELEFGKQSCVISTDKYFSDGLSVQWLDTLVYLTSPSSKSLVNIPQMIGRIVRKFEGKNYVTVYDIYNDDFDVECSRKLKREIKYKEFGYNIVNISSKSVDKIVDEIEDTINKK